MLLNARIQSSLGWRDEVFVPLVPMFQPGELVRWQNGCKQSQDSTVIEFITDMRRYKITEDKYMRTAFWEPIRTRKRPDSEGITFCQQF
jgi:hypothetical protein